MFFLEKLLENYKEKRSECYTEMSVALTDWSSFMSSLLNKEGLIERSSYVEKLSELYNIASIAGKLNSKFVILSDNATIEFKNLYKIFQHEVNSFESSIEKHNTIYLNGLINDARKVIGKIEEHNLDNQQMMCILKNASNHNVVAGAGTGKTTTIIGKVKYLFNTKKFKPNEILVLSYTHAAAYEMKMRLKRNVSSDIDVSTFHRFGYYILTTVEKKKPLIFSESPTKILKEQLSTLIQDNTYKKKLLKYIGNSSGKDCSDLDSRFQTIHDYQQYIQENSPTTLKGEVVRSYGEMHLANFLAANGISYIYEKNYEQDTSTENHAQYKPDFYLPDHNIYIEFFGIDRNGNAPKWFEGDNPTQTYQEGIEWKRNTHRKYDTKLIECYAYEDAEDILEKNLQEKLLAEGIELKDTPIEEILKNNGNSINHLISSFLLVAESVINLSRNKKLSSSDLLKIGDKVKYAKLTAELVFPLQRAYENHLASTNQIDFADMLIRAEQYISEGKYTNPFKCIIVDEYQDITASQYRLLKVLRANNGFDLFCVGDDWQSIYRFNGSDVSYIMDFEDFWGSSELSRIETTYRFPKSLIDVSGSFIMENPRQIKKTIQSNIQDNGFAISKIEGYKENSAIQFMTDRLLHLPENSSVYLIGRYTFDIKMLETEPRLSIKFDTASQTQKVLLQKRPDLNITFYTAHRSKGLQADYVFILNNTDGTHGFPSKVENNPLINMLLEHVDSFPYAEERRLFYVALTRAKKHVYLVTIKDKESIFEQELENKYESLLQNETYICPSCGGKLRIINGPYGKFFGCENYRKKKCRFSSKIPQ